MSASRKNMTKPGTVFDRRTVVVWGCLVASMTLASGVLLMLEQAPSAAASGLVLSVIDKDPATYDTIFATNPQVDPARWDCIIVHHTGQALGNAESVGQLHTTLGYGGLGYHFIIGNGNGAGDGDVQAGPRWMQQVEGVYAHKAISIALVGNGDQAAPTASQQAQLVRLVTTLQQRLHIPAYRVYLHREVAQTTSPGSLFPAGRFRQSLIEEPGR